MKRHSGTIRRRGQIVAPTLQTEHAPVQTIGSSQGTMFVSATVPNKPIRHGGRGLVRNATLALVWLAIASSGIVFTEPAPTDVLMLGAIVLLPTVGLAVFRPPLIVMGVILLVVCGFGFIATLFASDTAKATTHTAISLYLVLAAIVVAGFVARDPERHTRVIFHAHLIGALLAATAALVGYFDLVPGSNELFTKFGRARGTFKDPNVFGPFLVPAIVYALHVWFNRPFFKGLPAAAALVVLSLGLLLSFSRGAWAGAAIAISIYLYVTFVTTQHALDRLRVGALALAGLITVMGVLGAALQSETVADLFTQRASLEQSYDMGPEGRFGGQLKAIDVLLDNPFGIGAQEFPRSYHHEDVHNVYLSMFLNAGWIGGLIFMGLMLYTLGRGLIHAFGRSPLQGYFLIAFAALTATLLQGLLIDIDHWRHVYVLLGVVWALMRSIDATAVARPEQIIADRRSALLKPLDVLQPSSRSGRILGIAPSVICAKRRRLRQNGNSNRDIRILRAITPSRPARI